MKKVYSKPIDKYEEELEAFLNKGVYIPVENQEESILELQEAAKNYFKFKKIKV